MMMMVWMMLLFAAGALVARANIVKGTGLSEQGIRGEFFDRLEQVPTVFQNWATRIPSTSASEQYRWLGNVPTMRNFGTGRLARGLRSESYNVANEKYESTIEVDRDEISDDQLGHVMQRIQEMALAAALHKDSMISELIKNGHSAGFVAYDGKTFFATDHESGESGVQSNIVTPAAVDADKPTSAECRAGVLEAAARMKSFKNDRGLPYFYDSSGLVVVCHPAIEWQMREGLMAAMLSNTTNVAVGLADVVGWTWLDDEEHFFLLKTDGVPVKPFIFQDREPIEFGSLTENSEEGFKREKYLYGVRARYRLTYGMWQFAVKGTFTE